MLFGAAVALSACSHKKEADYSYEKTTTTESTKADGVYTRAQHK